MIKANLLTPDDPAWAAFLERVDHDFYHLPGYVAFEAAHRDGRPLAVHVDTGSGQMLFPIIVRDIPGGGADATAPYGYPGPLVDAAGTPPWLEAAWVAAIDRLRAEGLTSVFLRFHPLLSPPPPTSVGTAVLHGETVSMDLGQTREDAYQGMRRDIRRPIQKAAEAGVAAKQDVGFEHFPAFVELYRETMERLSAASGYFFDLAYFEGLRDVLGPRLSLWCVDIEGDVAVAGLFVETRGIIQYHLSAISDRHLEYAPNKVLVADVRDWGAARGDHSLHLGGGVGGSNDSLFHFKSGFSPLRHPFHTLRVVLDAARYEQLVAEHDPSLDPRQLEGYFPLYRA